MRSASPAQGSSCLAPSVPSGVGGSDLVTFVVRESGGSSTTHFKVRRSQKMTSMFREFSRRRDIALERRTQYDFFIDGLLVDAADTSRTLHLADGDVVEAVERRDESLDGDAAPPPLENDVPVTNDTKTEEESRSSRDRSLQTVLTVLDEAIERSSAQGGADKPTEEAMSACPAIFGTTYSRFVRGVGHAGSVVVISHVGPDADYDALRDWLKTFGDVVQFSSTCEDKCDGACARFDSAETANRAVVGGNGALFDGRRITLSHLVAKLPPSRNTEETRRRDQPPRSTTQFSSSAKGDRGASSPTKAAVASAGGTTVEEASSASSSSSSSSSCLTRRREHEVDLNNHKEEETDFLDGFAFSQTKNYSDGNEIDGTDGSCTKRYEDVAAFSSSSESQTHDPPTTSSTAVTSANKKSTTRHPDAAQATSGSSSSSPRASLPWAPQARASTVVCRWTIEAVERGSEASRNHKGEYHDCSFADEAGNRWLLYYFLDGDGAENAGHVSLYLSVRDPSRLPFGWQKYTTFTMTLEHPSGEGRSLSKWATQMFRAAPSPAVQDWGWPKFASHAELASRGLVDRSALRVRATVTVLASFYDIVPIEADDCLLSAARIGSVGAVKRCLRAGADARMCRDVASASARTPLHLACARGHRADADAAAAAIVPVLVAAGTDVDAEDAHGETALHLAVAKGANLAALALLEAGADPAKPVRDTLPREDALTLAAGGGRTELAISLLAAGAPPSSEAVLLASKKGHLDVLWPILDAAREDDCLSEVVNARNAKGDTALALLVARGLVDAAAKMVTTYRAPVADCSRDRKAARHARLRILLKQREQARNKLNNEDIASDGHQSQDDDDDAAAKNNSSMSQQQTKSAKRRRRRNQNVASSGEQNPHDDEDGEECDEEKARRKLVEELEAEEAVKEAKTAKAREKKRAKRQKQRKRKQNPTNSPLKPEQDNDKPLNDGDGGYASSTSSSSSSESVETVLRSPAIVTSPQKTRLPNKLPHQHKVMPAQPSVESERNKHHTDKSEASRVDDQHQQSRHVAREQSLGGKEETLMPPPPSLDLPDSTRSRVVTTRSDESFSRAESKSSPMPAVEGHGEVCKPTAPVDSAPGGPVVGHHENDSNSSVDGGANEIARRLSCLLGSAPTSDINATPRSAGVFADDKFISSSAEPRRLPRNSNFLSASADLPSVKQLGESKTPRAWDTPFGAFL